MDLFETVTCGEKKREMTSTSQSTLQTSRSHSEVCLYLGFLCCDMLQIVMGLFIGFSLLMISDILIEPGQGHRGYCSLVKQPPL